MYGIINKAPSVKVASPLRSLGMPHGQVWYTLNSSEKKRSLSEEPDGGHRRRDSEGMR